MSERLPGPILGLAQRSNFVREAPKTPGQSVAADVVVSVDADLAVDLGIDFVPGVHVVRVPGPPRLLRHGNRLVTHLFAPELRLRRRIQTSLWFFFKQVIREDVRRNRTEQEA
jgi:hypothetical protein